MKVTFTEDEKKDDIRGAKRILNELESLAIKGAESQTGEKKYKPALLLLLDNVDHAELLQPPYADLISGKEWLKVLATTRMGPEELGADETKQSLLTIDELPFDDALSLIESYQPGRRFKNETEKEKAGEIVKLLGCFTLAVEVAALYLYERKGQITCAAFLELQKREGIEFVGEKTKTVINHTKLISATIAPTLDMLSPQETLILNYASLLPPDTIPLPWIKELVIKEFSELGTEVEPGLDDPWLTTINHLLSLRLIQIVDFDVDGLKPRIVRMHRLVQEMIETRQQAQKEKLKTDLIDYVKARSDYFWDGWVKKETRWEIKPINICALFLMQKMESGTPYIANQIHRALINLGYYSEAKELLKKAIEIDEQNYEPNHSTLAIGYSNLGLVEFDLGYYREAKELTLKAIRIEERLLKNNDSNLAKYYNNLSRVERKLGNLTGAKEWILKAIIIDEQIYGTKHREVGIDYFNLAQIERDLGNFKYSKELYIKAIDIDSQNLGPNHPELATDYNDLALVEKDLGNLKEAKELLKKAILIYEQNFEPNHPSLAISYSNLASVEQDLGNLKEAEILFRNALEIRKVALPPGRANLINSYTFLADLLEKTGRNDEAKEYRLLALEANPDNATPLQLRESSIQYILRGQYQKAEEMLKRILQHNFELSSTHCHYARVCLMTDRLSEAKEHIKEAIKFCDEAKLYVKARIIWFQILFDFLDGRNAENYLSQLKTILKEEDAFMDWTMHLVLDHIKSKISEQNHSLLTALVAALSNKENVDKLNEFKEWREAKERF